MAQQQTTEYMALEAMTEDLYNALPISDLLPKMISKRVITFPEKADIRAGGTTREQVDVFLSKLTGEMLSKENKRFYAFIEVMRESPKCDFLVERMEKWINHYKGLGTPPAIPAAQSVFRQYSVTQPTSQQSPVTVTRRQQVNYNGHEIKNLMLMHKHVIPNISADWEVVAAFLDYNIPTINLIKRAHRRLPRECCTELLQDWITTDNGVKPKTYEKFIEVLSQIGSLAMVARQIKQCLSQEGVLGGDQRASHQQWTHRPMPAAPVPQQTDPTEYLDEEKVMELQEEVFTNCRQYIVQHLSADDIVDCLISKRLIGQSAKQQLGLHVTTPQEKNRIIVDELSSGRPYAFSIFCEILKKNGRTKHIADHLKKEWNRLLQSSLQSDSEQPLYSPPINTKVLHTTPARLPQVATITATNTTATAGEHRGIAAHRQPTPPGTHKKISVPIDDEVTFSIPVEEGQMTSPTEQTTRESFSQEVTSPISESAEGYFQSTGIELEQDDKKTVSSITKEIGQLGKSPYLSAAVAPTATTPTMTSYDVTTTHAPTHDVITATPPANTTSIPKRPDVTAALDNVFTSATTTPAIQPAPADLPPSGGNDGCLRTGKDSKRCMRLMRRCVIPKIHEEWEAVAAFLDYSIQAKEDIKTLHKTPKDCCTALLEDWATTDNGAKPKSWRNLLDILSEIEELEEVVDEIEACLISEGAVLDGTAPRKENEPHRSVEQAAEDETGTAAYKESQCHHLEDQAVEDNTDTRWNHQPESSMSTMAGSEVLEYPLHHHPSYNLPSVELDQRYGKQMAADQQPQAAYTPPHAFVVYAKDETDPHGDHAWCLSNLLYNCGIICDTDLYHVDENIIDPSLWVDNNLKNHLDSPNCYIILMCSPTMMSLLMDERNPTVCIEMVASYINCWILNHYLQQNPQKFLPFLVDDTPADCIPPILSEQTCYRFPYDRLCEISEGVSAHELLKHPEFASIRDLVVMLTRVQDIPVVAGSQEDMTAQSTGRDLPTDANAVTNDPGTTNNSTNEQNH